MGSERPDNLFDTRSARDAIVTQPTEHLPPETPASELDEPSWSVISFKRTEAASLTYRQAIAAMNHLDSQGLAGLCIVTDEAAARLAG